MNNVTHVKEVYQDNVYNLGFGMDERSGQFIEKFGLESYIEFKKRLQEYYVSPIGRNK